MQLLHSETKEVVLSCIAILDTKCFMLGKEAPCITRHLYFYKPFDLQPVTYSLLLTTFNSNVINAG